MTMLAMQGKMSYDQLLSCSLDWSKHSHVTLTQSNDERVTWLKCRHENIILECHTYKHASFV